MSWNPMYYWTGISLYSAKFKVSNHFNFLEHIPLLEKKLRKTLWRQAVVWKQIGSNEFAFRHKMTSRNPVLGVIRIDDLSNEVIFVGYMSWSLLVLFIGLLILALTSKAMLPAIVITGIAGANTLIQYFNYSNIYQIIYPILAKDGEAF